MKYKSVLQIDTVNVEKYIVYWCQYGRGRIYTLPDGNTIEINIDDPEPIINGDQIIMHTNDGGTLYWTPSSSFCVYPDIQFGPYGGEENGK